MVWLLTGLTFSFCDQEILLHDGNNVYNVKYKGTGNVKQSVLYNFGLKK